MKPIEGKCTANVKKGALKNFSKFAEKHLYWSPFFNKVAGLTPATLLKKTLWHKCFPVKFGKFLGTIFFQNTSGRLVHCFNRNKDGQFFRTCSVNKVCISDLFDLLLLNPFQANFSISYPLKKNKKTKGFFWCFQGV